MMQGTSQQGFVESGPDRFLPKGRTVQVGEFAQVRIECVQGLLWVTEPPDPKDHILVPGQVLSLRGSGIALANALEDSRYRIADPAVSPRGIRAGSGTGWWHALPRRAAAFLFRILKRAACAGAACLGAQHRWRRFR